MNITTKIQAALDRLDLDEFVVEAISPEVVDLYDDHGRGTYKAEDVLRVLAGIADDDGDPNEALWQGLYDLEIK